MSMDPHNPDTAAEILVEHRRWIRLLARELVGDDGDPDDVAQEASLEVLRHPPRSKRNLRGWLRALVRNRARQDARARDRREDRERAAPSLREEPSSQESAARWELHRLLVEAVMDLKEPYREAVTLRFLDELPVSEVAARLGVPLRTAESRVHRALDQLRERLDRRMPGGRQEWLSVLAPLVSSGMDPAAAVGAGVGGGGAIVMAVKTKGLLAAASVLVLLGSGWWWVQRTVLESPSLSEPTSLDSEPRFARTENYSARSNVELRAVPEAEASRVLVAEESAPSVTIHGRVVDARRFPVEGASVHLVLDSAPTAVARTDSEGRFLFRVPSVESGGSRFVALYASDGEGSCGVHSTQIRDPADEGALLSREEGMDCGPIVLLPGHAIDCVATGPRGPVPGTKIRVECGLQRIPVLVLESDTEGRAHAACLPAGDVTLLASADDGLQGRTTVLLPKDSGSLVPVPLVESARLEVFVADHDGRPVEGAAVEAWEEADPRDLFVETALDPWAPRTRPVPGPLHSTDAEGRTVLDGLERGAHLTIRASRAGAAAIKGSSETWTGERNRAMRLVLDTRRRTVRWNIDRGGQVVPPDGTVLALRSSSRSMRFREVAPEAAGRVEHGEVVVEGVVGSWSGLAEAPDGSLAVLAVSADSEPRSEVMFRLPRSIQVQVLRGDGAGFEGARVGAWSQAGSPMALAALTDDAGNAILTPWSWDLVDVVMELPGQGRRTTLGSVDLSRGDGHLVHRLEAEYEVVLQCRFEGRAVLPQIFRWYCKEADLRTVEERPKEGEVLLRLRPYAEGPITLVLHSREYLPAVTTLRPPEGDGSVHVTLELTRSGSVAVTVLPPSDHSFGLVIQSWIPERNAWSGPGPFHQHRPNGPGGAYCFESLPAGRHRVLDTRSGGAVEFWITDAGEHRECTLDLSHVGRVEGVVEIPEGESIDDVRLVCIDDVTGLHDIWERRPRKDAQFALVVDGLRPVTIEARHPTLIPAAEGGRVTVQGPRGGVVLRLERSPVHTFRVHLETDPEGSPELELKVFRGAPDSTPFLEKRLRIDDGAVRFGGVPPGRWTIWMNGVYGCAPLLLHDVELGVEPVDLGELEFPAGSSIHLPITIPSGESCPRLFAGAFSKGVPEYSRQINSRGESEPVIPGLGPGTFRIQVRTIGGSRELLDEVVVVDGVHDVVLPIDLR